MVINEQSPDEQSEAVSWLTVPSVCEDGFCDLSEALNEFKSKTEFGANLPDNRILLVTMRLWETPVHIPNTMVKT